MKKTLQTINQTIYIGADHAGFAQKEAIKHYLIQLRYKVIDCGNTHFDKNDDYPDFAYLLAKEVVQHRALGILLCGSAEGMGIAANKVKGIRAVVAHTLTEAKLTREHNNANILCLSAWHTSLFVAKKIIRTWLTTPFSRAQRHHRRIQKILRIERAEFA